MTERNLLIKFAVSSTDSDYCAIAAQAPTAIRVFRISDSNDENNSNNHLLYTVSAIPRDELLSLGNNGIESSETNLISSHSTVNETLTAMNMNSSSNKNNNNVSTSSKKKQNNNNNKTSSAISAANSNNNNNFSCELVMGTSSGRVSLFDCITGKLRWSRFVPDGSSISVRAVSVSGDFVFAVTSRHTLSVFDVHTGKLLVNGAKNITSTGTSSLLGSTGAAASFGTAKSMTSLVVSSSSNEDDQQNNNNNLVYCLVGSLQPVLLRMSAMTTSTTSVLEPVSHCRVQQAPVDQVKLFEVSCGEQNNNFLLASTCVYSEGIIRIWNMLPQQQKLNNNNNNNSAVCLHVLDISSTMVNSAGNGAATNVNLHQRLNFVDVSLSSSSSSSQQQQLIKVAACSISGTMFLWEKKLLNEEQNESLLLLNRESTSTSAPCSTLLSPEADARKIRQQQRRHNKRLPVSTSSRIVCGFFQTTQNNNNQNHLVILRRNWSAPTFQSWPWRALASSSENAVDAASIKVLPSSISAFEKGQIFTSEEEMKKRLIHMPAFTGKLHASGALKGLDLPTAGVFAFPQVSLFRASEVGELPTYKQQQAAASTEQEEGDDQEEEQEEGKISIIAAAAKRKRAGVAPALYQALHAEDISLIMEILNVADRSDADRNATVLSLSIPYITQLLHMLSKRILNDGDGARSALHAWVSAIMQLRGNELFQLVSSSSNTDNENENTEARNVKAALLLLLEHYRGILSTVGTQLAFTAGRSSIFKAVRRRATNVKNKRQIKANRFEDGPRFIDTSRGVIHSEHNLYSKLSRGDRKKLKKFGAEGELVGDEDDAFDGEDDAKALSKRANKNLFGAGLGDGDEDDDEENEDDEENNDEENVDNEDEDEENDDEEGIENQDEDKSDEDEFAFDEEDLDEIGGDLNENDEEEEENDDDNGEDEEEEEEGDDDDGNEDDDDDEEEDSDDDDDEGSMLDDEQEDVVEHLKTSKRDVKLNSQVQYD